MQYIEWVERVFEVIAHEYVKMDQQRGLGVSEIIDHLGVTETPNILRAVSEATDDLQHLGLIVDEHVGLPAFKPTQLARTVRQSGGLSSLWGEFARNFLDEEQRLVLSMVVEYGENPQDSYALLQVVALEELATKLGPSWAGRDKQVRLARIGDELTDMDLTQSVWADLKPTYKGIVWVRQNSPPWRKLWEPVGDAPIAAGGQGTVIKVARRSDGMLGALKQLHVDLLNDRERRRRMEREVRILQQVQIAGVPKVLDHNMELSESVGSPLYVVVEWIAGKTLQQYIDGRPTDLDDALQITYHLAVILQACHEEQIFHRDIKPDNIILRTDTNTPMLVDFGIAWAAPTPEGVAELRTDRGQELGNRFLRIPDFAAGRDKRDPRADLTLLVGILVFLLTGRSPRVLRDEHDQPPHQALASAFRRPTTADPRWPQIQSLFDRGFQRAVADRFQTAAELIGELNALMNAT